MSHAPLTRLAEAAGISPRWKDFHGEWHDVAPETLRAVLSALGLPAATDAEVEDSLAGFTGAASTLPPLMTAQVGEPISLPTAPGRYRLTLEDGTVREDMAGEHDGCALLPLIEMPGYHRLTLGELRVHRADGDAGCAERCGWPD